MAWGGRFLDVVYGLGLKDFGLGGRFWDLAVGFLSGALRFG